jgi:hypothetical protein
MDNADFDHFRAEMFQLYQQGRYTQALDLMRARPGVSRSET